MLKHYGSFNNTALIAGVGNSLLKLFFMRQRPTFGAFSN